ncbi:copper-translocating P-type ATPase [Persephonella sp. IF05-L8]|uniref:copper-translocating P-type ATPase n=1 Tax=Persephonella sp. IF05-L8 TaxID=1158338 RepID=UPI000A5DC0BE
MEKPLIQSNEFLNLKNILSLIFASIVQFGAGWEFYRFAIGGLKNRIADMNLLVVIGTSAAYFYSVFVIFFPFLFPENMRSTYFGGAAAIITFVLLGRYLESSSRNKATGFLRKLLKLKPQKALIIVDGKEVEVPADSIVVGDIVVVKAGERIPVDGVVIEGSGDIDQSILTGESLPVLKKTGDTVLGGSLLVDGYILIKATKTGKDAFIYQLTKLVSQAQEKKPPVGRLADKVVAVFVPAILIISILTFDVWYLLDKLDIAFLSSVSVLIIACPCALGIATPIAIVVAVSKGAKEKILIKNPEIIEGIKDITLAIFDKTGTITEGKLSVVEEKTFDKQFLKYAYPALKNSNHPVAKAVLKKIPEYEAKPENFKSMAGKGIIAIVEGKRVVAGNKVLLEEHGFVIEENSEETELFIAVEDKLVAAFYLSDNLKPEAKAVLDKLKEKGIKTILLTGDKKEVAEKICAEAGFDECFAQLKPEDKYRIVKELQQKGEKVMFIGDGINDAPAMASANVGIAVVQATDITKETGDILLLRNDLSLVLKAINLSAFSMNVIKQNLFWAFIYNIIGIPVAAGILYPVAGILLKPVIAGVAMSFSSVSVVLNALRINNARLGD